MAYRDYVPFCLFIIIHLFLEIESFAPVGRYSHSSVLVENKLYFFGGDLPNSEVTDYEISNEVFYLDVSQPFNIQDPPWNDLTSSAGIPFKSIWAAASLSNINNEKIIYLFGGVSRNLNNVEEDYFVSNIYSFNLNSLKCDIPNAKGKVPERRRQISSVIDDTGKMYIFSGGADSVIGSPTTKFFNDMVIFNTIDLSWLILTPANAPGAQVGYSATLLSNGVIVYIGGYDSAVKTIDISQIVLYDTKFSTWSNKVCTNVKYYINRII
jgi:N-acetylneuraminic acid mutarotase